MYNSAVHMCSWSLAGSFCCHDPSPPPGEEHSRHVLIRCQTHAALCACIGRAGGAYIPPFRLARMMAEIDDKNSVAAQKLSWEALRKSLNGLINKV